jgi:error-prone DNA polymerase
MSYTELQITSNFSFLRGGSHPHELVEQAAALGYKAVAITDHNTLAGVVRAHVAAKKAGLRLIVGCRLELLDGPPLLAYPTDRKAYARLSGLLSLGNRRAEKGRCHLYKADVYQYALGIRFVSLPPLSLNEAFDFGDDYKQELQEYRDNFGNALYLGISRSYHANDNKRLYRLKGLSESLGIKLVATNDVYYHEPARRQLQDVLTCIREKSTQPVSACTKMRNATSSLRGRCGAFSGSIPRPWKLPVR